VRTGRGVAILGGYDSDRALVESTGRPMEAYFMAISTPYVFIKCVECGRDFICEVTSDVVVWPLPGINVPEEVPKTIGKVMGEAKIAHAVRAETAALLAARTTLIRMQRHLKCSGIDELVSRGTITPGLAEQAHEIRLWANATGHDEVPDDVPSTEDVDQLLKFIDILFDTIFVQPKKLAALRDKRVNTAKRTGES
jgi:hypothetical protein